MSKQNIYDEEAMFAGYATLRARPDNANDLVETPAMLALLPELTGKTVLDLGCGAGGHCAEYARRGAKRVLGTDISEKMLAAAREHNIHPAIEYRRMAMEDVAALGETFDVVCSSLAMHYVKDFHALMRAIFAVTNPGGMLVFSQESPLTSCYCDADGARWERDENGEKRCARLAHYGEEGERVSEWFIEGVVEYHRMFSTVINDLAQAGFLVEQLSEAVPDAEFCRRYPLYTDNVHRPDFLLVRARKPLF
ncbi:MAG: class I SAM-dependent methyltransferase [Oscillospiraceae bacterium]